MKCIGIVWGRECLQWCSYHIGNLQGIVEYPGARSSGIITSDWKGWGKEVITRTQKEKAVLRTQCSKKQPTQKDFQVKKSEKYMLLSQAPLSLIPPAGASHWPTSQRTEGKEACWCSSYRLHLPQQEGYKVALERQTELSRLVRLEIQAREGQIDTVDSWQGGRGWDPTLS